MSNGRQTLFDELTDPNHPSRQREWNAFLEMRAELLEQILEKLQLGEMGRGIGVPDIVGAVDQQALQGAVDHAADPLAGVMRERDRQQMFGSAMWYGIDPIGVPLEELEQQIVQARMRRREALDAGEAGWWDADANFLKTAHGIAAVGTADALTRTAETLPFIGRWMSDRKSVQALNQWIGMAREAHVGRMGEGEQKLAMAAETGFGLVAYAVPGIAAWKLVGAGMGVTRLSGVIHAWKPGTVGALTGRTATMGGRVLQEVAPRFQISRQARILHNSLQGGLAGFMLESGGDGPIQEKAVNITLGFGLGAAFEVGGRVGAATFGAVGGGIVGASVDEPYAGAITGALVGLGARRAWKSFSAKNGIKWEKASVWDDLEYGPAREWTRDGIVVDLPMLPKNPLDVDPSMTAVGARYAEPGAIGAGPRQLGAGPDVPPRPGQLPGAPEAPGLLPAQTQTSVMLDQYNYRGTRKLFYNGPERPSDLIEQWNNVVEGRPQMGLSNSRIKLDNTGRFGVESTHVQALEVEFRDAFVLTPESAPLFRQLVGEADNIGGIEVALRDRGFDGLVVQGMDDVIDMVGPEAVMQLGIPFELMGDQVYAFGRPNQVRFTKTVVDGDLLDEVFREYGSVKGRQVAAIQAATFSSEARRMLGPFPVGPQKERLARVPEWLSESKGLPFVKDPEVKHPLVPDEITRGVLQHHAQTGPRVVLLDAEGTARAVVPVESLEEGAQTLARMGFKNMDPNNQQDAIRLAHEMSKGDIYTTTSLLDRLWNAADATDLDLVVASFVDNPGRVSVISGVGEPQKVLANIQGVAAKYDIGMSPNNVRIAERDGTFHVFVGPEGSISNKMVKQFEDFGTFVGNRAMTADGVEVRVNSVWREADGRERASISPLYSSVDAKVPLSYVLPDRTSAVTPIRRQDLVEFENFAVGKFNEEAVVSGIPLAEEVIDPRVLSLIDSYIEDFGNSKGLVSQYDLQDLAMRIEGGLVERFRQASGENGAFHFEMMKDSFEETTKSTLQGRFVEPDLETLARAKGLVWEPPWRGKHGQIVDQGTNMVIPFADRNSAEVFVRNFHREYPDLVHKGMEYGEVHSPGLRGHAEHGSQGVEFVTDGDEIRALEGNVRAVVKDIADLEDQIARATEFHEAVAQSTQGMEGVRGVEGVEGVDLPPPVDLFGAPPLPPEPPRGGGPPRDPTEPPAPPPEPPTPPSRDPVEAAAEATLGRLPPRTFTASQAEAEAVLTQIKDKFGPDDTLGRRAELENLLNGFSMTVLRPMRLWAERLDRYFRSVGVDNARMWRDVDGLLHGKSLAEQQAIPWMRRMSEQVRVFKRADRRLGRLYEAMTEPQIPGVEPFGHMAFTPKEREAAVNIRKLLDDLHTEVLGFAPETGYITDYLPRLRYFTDTMEPKQAWEAWKKILPENLKWFALYARTGHLNMYQKDIGRVLDTYIRGLHFEKFARLHFERVKYNWTDERIPAALRSRMEGWLFTVRHGFPAGHDSAVRGVTSFVNKGLSIANKISGGLIPKAKVTNEEVLNAFGMGLTAQYRNALGYNTAAIFREILQPFLLLGEHGPVRLFGGYARYIGDKRTRALWNQRAEKFGWAEPNRNAVVNSEFFTGEVGQGNIAKFSAEELAAREQFARFFDRIHDRLPHRFRSGVEGDPIADPNWGYRTFATNPGRIISGNIGYERGMEALSAFRRGEIDYARMMRRSDAINQHESFRIEFEDLVRAGNDEAAAGMLGHESMKSQFMFGIAEQPEAIRNAGAFGRLVMQFGNFSLQNAWRTSQQFVNRLKGSGVRGAVQYGAGIAALPFLVEYVADKTGHEGWRRLNWYRSLSFGGGMAVDPLLNLTRSIPGAIKTIMGDDLSPEEQFAVARFKDQWGGVPLNPYGGGTRTVRGLFDALGDRDPAVALFLFSTTRYPHSDTERRRVIEPFAESISEAGRQFSEQFGRDPTPQQAPQAPFLRQQGITPAEWERFQEMVDSIAAEGGGSRQ